MSWHLDKRPLKFEPMVALSADIRRIHGKEPAEPQGADLWQSYNAHLDAMEKLAGEAVDNPILLGKLAKTTLYFVRDQRRLLRRYFRARFGIKIMSTSWLPNEKRLSSPTLHIMDRERARPKTLLEVAYQYDLLYTYMIFEEYLRYKAQVRRWI